MRPARAWLDGIASHGWRVPATLVAETAGMTLAELLAAEGDRFDALTIFCVEIDAAALAALTSSGSVRDRLFDALMAGFDRVQSDRAATLALLAARDPAIAAIAGRALLASLRRIADAAGVDLRLPLGPLRLATLGAVHARAMAAWRRDDSPDMAAVMASLDRDLTRAEAWAEGRGEIASLRLGALIDRLRRAPRPSPDPPTESDL